MEPELTEALPISLTERGRQIEILFSQQIGRIRFHFSKENDYRSQEESSSRLMLDLSIPDEKHLEFARAKIKWADSYKDKFVGPLQKLNEDIQEKLLEFERLLHVGRKDSIFREETMRTVVDLREQLSCAKTMGEMDRVRAQFDNLATEAAERGESSLEALLEEAANGIRSVIYREAEKHRGMTENALLEQQRKHEAAIRADNIMRRPANSEHSANIEHWLSLSKELQRARVMATNGIADQIEFDKRLPTVIITNNGRADLTFSEETSRQLIEDAEAYATLIKAASEDENRIQQEREPLATQLFALDHKASAAVIQTPITARPVKDLHPLEGKSWFRLVKVIYIGLWITGLGLSALVAYGSRNFLVFVVGTVILAIVLIALKRVFYYVTLGRGTATEEPGTGFVDLEDLRDDFAGVRANSPELYQQEIAPLLEAWEVRYGRRVPLQELTNFSNTSRMKAIQVRQRYQNLINEAACKGGTIETSNLRKNLEQSMAEYEGPDRQEFIQRVERFLVSLETKFGAAIPIDEACKILDELENDIRAQRQAPV